MLRQVKHFWVQWSRALSSFFGQILPAGLAFILSIVLVVHIIFELSEAECGAIGEKYEGYLISIELVEKHKWYLIAIECGSDSFIKAISSADTRNLSLLLAASIGWFFFYWRAKSADRGVTVERFTRSIEQLTNSNTSICLGSIRSLEQIASSHEEEREKIIQILSARIHELAPLNDEMENEVWRRKPEIKSAIEALANIAEPLGSKKRPFCVLNDVNLCKLFVEKTNLSYFSLMGSNLSNSTFKEVDFSYTKLSTSFINGTTFENCKNLTKEQIMEVNWVNGRTPRGLPEEWELPPEHIAEANDIKQEQMLIKEKYLPKKDT